MRVHERVITSRWSVLLVVSLAAACGGGSRSSTSTTPTTPTPSPAPTPPTVTSVVVTGTVTLTSVNQTAQLIATARLSTGSTGVVTAQATWQTSNPSVVTVSSGGLVTARTAGTATITATYQGRSGTLSMTVTSVTPIPSVSGAWRGSYVICCGVGLNEGSMIWVLTQAADGRTVTGSMTIVDDFLLGETTGSIQGTWDAARRAFRFTVTVPPGGIEQFPACPMAFEQGELRAFSAGAPGTGGPYIQGTFGGTFCGSTPIVQGIVQLLKQ